MPVIFFLVGQGFFGTFIFLSCCRNSVWLFVRYLLYCVCLCLILILVYKHLPDPTWAYELDIPDSVCHQPWTH